MRRTFIILMMIMLAGCSSGQLPTPTESIETEEPALPTPISSNPGGTVVSVTQAVDVADSSTATHAPIATPARKDQLPADAWKDMPVIPADISDRAHAIYEYGIYLGNDPTHFSVIGDCQNVSSYFMSVFDNPGEYNLGPDYSHLQPTIDYYSGSFSRQSLAVKGGFNAAAVLSPLRSDPESCNANESPLDCELRTWKPSIVIVSMETWWSEKPAEEYDKYMRLVLDRIIETGALPVIATKADNLEGDHAINATVAQIAYDYEIPLWNFWAAVQPLPNHGLSSDNFHLTFARNFFDDRQRMRSAWPWRNLTALQMLDLVRNKLNTSP